MGHRAQITTGPRRHAKPREHGLRPGGRSSLAGLARTARRVPAARNPQTGIGTSTPPRAKGAKWAPGPIKPPARPRATDVGNAWTPYQPHAPTAGARAGLAEGAEATGEVEAARNPRNGIGTSISLRAEGARVGLWSKGTADATQATCRRARVSVRPCVRAGLPRTPAGLAPGRGLRHQPRRIRRLRRPEAQTMGSGPAPRVNHRVTRGTGGLPRRTQEHPETIPHKRGHAGQAQLAGKSGRLKRPETQNGIGTSTPGDPEATWGPRGSPRRTPDHPDTNPEPRVRKSRPPPGASHESRPPRGVQEDERAKQKFAQHSW